MNISASQVKELREATGVGMMDCKKALAENGGDMEKAIIWLRERGMSRAAQKAGRIAAEGVVVFALNSASNKAAILELNCETDFSGKNEDFRAFADKIAEIALKSESQSAEALLEASFEGSKTVASALTELIAKVGENMNLRRVQFVTADYISAYSHMAGKIGTLVMFSGAQSAALKDLGADLAMHVAACSPKYFDSYSVDASELEQEKDIARKKILEQGKTGPMVEKILEGQIQRFYKEVCFIDQPFVKEQKLSVAEHAKQAVKDASLKGFLRFQLGEGIEVKKGNFAEEVAAQIAKS